MREKAVFHFFAGMPLCRIFGSLREHAHTEFYGHSRWGFKTLAYTPADGYWSLLCRVSL